MRLAFCYTFSLLLLFSCKDDDTVNPESGPWELTEDEQALVDKLYEESVEVDTNALLIEDDALFWLDDLGDKRVVGLGEATHGTKEFFEMKGRIFRYLAEHHQYKTFAIEADFAESFYINRYVQGGPGAIASIMTDHMHFWTWRTTEVLAILEWMRQFNESNIDESPVQYIGVDCQYMTYQPILLNDYLHEVAPDFEIRIGNAIAPLLAENENDFKSTAIEQIEDWQDTLSLLELAMEEYRDVLVDKSDAFTYEMHKHLLRSLSQVMQSKYYAAQSNNAYNWRDDFMAENVLWYQTLLNTDQKICVWAHNAHVAANPDYGGGGAMGHHLSISLNSHYEVIGFGFTSGKFTAIRKSGSNYVGLRTNTINDRPKVRSYNYIFDRVPGRGFTVDLEDLQDDQYWSEYLFGTRSFLEIGSVFSGNAANYYRHVDMDHYYDRIIYYKRTEAAEQL